MLLGNLHQNKKILIYAGLTVTIIIVIIAWAAVLLSQKTFYSGISVDGQNLSDLDMEKARDLVTLNLEEQYKNKEITLKYKGNIWICSLDNISYHFLVEDVLEKAYSIGRTGNIFNRLNQILHVRFNKMDMRTDSDFNRKQLKSKLNEIKKKIDKKEKDASAECENDRVTFTKEETGYLLNIGTNMQMLENSLLARKFDNLELVVEEKKPRILLNEIKEIGSMLSVFVTRFNAGDSDRTHNIRLACERINNTVLLPGEIFSMNKALGPRTIENGYREAPVIFKNELIKGPGGGVCQATTTLYGAVLKAKIDVIERTHHSLPLGYVDPGQDATIAEGFIDFKFQNSEDYPVLISAEAVGSNLRIKIFGKEKSEKNVVKLKSEIIDEFAPAADEIIIDDTVPDGEKMVERAAKKGFRVVVYRETYTEDGVLLDREKVSEDVYKPVRGQIKVNSKYNNTNAD